MEDRRADDDRNRRVRNRTHGGVGGGAPQGPLLPDWAARKSRMLHVKCGGRESAIVINISEWASSTSGPVSHSSCLLIPPLPDR